VVLIRSVLSLWAWLIVLLVTMVGVCIQAPLLVVTWPFDRSRAIAGRLTRLLAVVIVRLHPMWRFRIHGSTRHYRPRKTVVVSNHVSNSDSWLICTLPREMKWLAKASLFKIPLVGWSMSMAGDIAVVRGDRDSARRAMARCAEYLAMDMPVIIFPEGTRSRTGDLLPFRDGAFRLAIETGSEVLPIAIAGTGKALEKHSWRHNFARAYVTVGQPISTQAMTLDDLEDLKAEARRRIETLRETIAPLASS
jgi:1-acyl-sn-glycerol-3-phosphate acyltransferase